MGTEGEQNAHDALYAKYTALEPTSLNNSRV